MVYVVNELGADYAVVGCPVAFEGLGALGFCLLVETIDLVRVEDLIDTVRVSCCL